MPGETGNFLLGLTLITALYAALAVLWGLYRQDPRWSASGRNALHATALLAGSSLAVLLTAFLADNFELSYVAEHSSRTLSPWLKISALWAGQEGSLLLWVFLQALCAAAVLIRPAPQARPLLPWTTALLSLTTAFFAGLTFFLSNPFQAAAVVRSDGLGLNPLLRHPGMALHPPALYLGYVGLAVPFAFAVAALIARRLDSWPAVARRWTLAAWWFLGLGLLLGARWAYDVLGWGGYWSWDPVENAGLMPWLTATALLHGSVIQEQRGTFRRWNALLAVLSFILVLFGTFATRSGLIQSVHAYTRSNLGPWFLGAIGLTLLLAVGLLIRARTELRDPRPADAFISREGAFHLTLLLLMTLTISVFIGSTLPTLTTALTSRTFEAGPAWFDRVTGPQFALLILLLGICPLLGRAAGTARRLGPLYAVTLTLGTLILTAIAFVLGFTQPLALLGFAVTGLAGAATLTEYALDALARRQATGEPLLNALLNLFALQRRRYGGYLVHAGIILMAVGVLGTRMAPFEEQYVLHPGQPQPVNEYTLVYEELKSETAADHLAHHAVVSVYRDGVYQMTLTPALDEYQTTGQTATTPALQIGWRQDLYLVLAGWEEGGATATFKVIIARLINFLWLGGLVFLAGGAIAFWPVAAADRQRRDLPALAFGALLLIGAGTAMWGLSHGAVVQETARPLAGRPAPDFTFRPLDETPQSLNSLRGKTVVLNFWASWCPSCKTELPALQALHEEFPAVQFLGAAYQDDAAAVRQTATDYGLTYPIGLDDALAAHYGITGVPETFIIDAGGRLAYVHIGPVEIDQLRQEIKELEANK